MSYLSVTVGLYLHLAVSVCHEIKLALGIYCFRSGKLALSYYS
jgi:ethanolaminephosphotransferase